MCFFTLEIELWEKLWQMLHVLPLSVLMTYFLKYSGDWTSYEPKMCRLINNEKLIKSCTFISRKNTTFFCFCAGSCVCPAPFWFPQLLHTLYRNTRSCLGNACFLCGSSHCIRIYEKIHGKGCRFCHFRLWRCTVWSHLETEILKRKCLLGFTFELVYIICDAPAMHLALCRSRPFLVPTFAPHLLQLYVNVLGKCLLSIWFMTLYNDLWENSWHKLQIFPHSVGRMYFLKSSCDRTPKHRMYGSSNALFPSNNR